MAERTRSGSSKSRQRSNRIALITLVVYACGVLYYMLVYVPRHRAELSDEAVAELASAANQIATRLAAIDSIWQTEAQRVSPKPAQLRRQLDRLNHDARPLRFSSPRLANDDVPCQAAGEPMLRSARLDMASDPVALLYRSRDLCGEVAVAAIVDGILKSISNDLFDDLGVATVQGDVVLEYPRGSVRTATLQTVFSQLAAGGQAASSASPTGISAAPSAPSTSSSSSGESSSGARAERALSGGGLSGWAAAGVTRVSEVRLGESDYVVFLEPVGWPLRWRIGDSSAPMLLYGIVDARKLWTRSITVPGHLLAVWILAVLALLAYLWALLKLWIMSPGEGFRPIEAMFFAASVLGALGLLVMLALYENVKDLGTRDQENRLANLAETIDSNLTKELGSALTVLDRLSDCTVTKGDSHLGGRQTGASAVNLACSGRRPGIPRPLEVDQPAVVGGPPMYWAAHLFDVARDPLEKYPYPDVVFWTNKTGIQTLKLCASDDCTSQTDLGQFAWFQRAAARQLFTMGGTETNLRFQLDCLYSPNTGQYEALLLAPRATESDDYKFVGLAVPLLSLIAPIVPPGYGFAVIDQRGAVKFHSNASLNGTNSFLSDWQGEARLGSEIALSASGPFSGMYRGDPSHAYLRPLGGVNGLGWFVVAIHSDTGWNTFSLRVLLLAMFGCVAFGAPIAVLASVAGWRLAVVSRPAGGRHEERRPPPTWYWPDVTKRRVYIELLVVYAALTVIGLVSRWIWAALLLPSLAIVLTWARLRRHYRQHDETARSGHTPRDRTLMAVLYTANAMFAGVLIIILPASLIVREAFEVERIGYLSQVQLGLAEAIIGRNELIQQRLSPFAGRDVIGRMQLERYDRHDCGWFNDCDNLAPAVPSATSDAPPSVASIPSAAAVVQWFQRVSSDPFGVATSFKPATWSLDSHKQGLLLRWPTSDVSVISTLPGYHIGASTAALMVIATLGVAIAVWFVSCRRFTLLRDLPSPWPEYRFESTVSENMLLLAPPHLESLHGKEEPPTRTIDLSHGADVPDESDRVILLMQVERTLEQRSFRERALRTIQSVIARPHSRAVVVSTIDPVFWLKEMRNAGTCEAAEYSRWVSVFSALKRRRLPFPEKPEAPDEYHHLLWSTCTQNEKVALLQLARDGFVNPKNWGACRHLAQRGLVGRRETSLFAINSAAFCDFVLSGFAEEEVETYIGGDDRLPWRTLRLVILCTVVLLVAFLGFSLQEVFGAAAGSLVSITAGLTGVVTLVSNLRQVASLRLPFVKGSGSA